MPVSTQPLALVLSFWLWLTLLFWEQYLASIICTVSLASELRALPNQSIAQMLTGCAGTWLDFQ